MSEPLKTHFDAGAAGSWKDIKCGAAATAFGGKIVAYETSIYLYEIRKIIGKLLRAQLYILAMSKRKQNRGATPMTEGQTCQAF